MGFKQLSEMENVHLVLMGTELQSAGILFLEHGIHFSLNLVLDIVMNVSTMVCTLPECRKGTLASPSCLAVFYSKERWGKYLYEIGLGSRRHQVIESTFRLPGFVISSLLHLGDSLRFLGLPVLPCPGSLWHLTALPVLWRVM